MRRSGCPAIKDKRSDNVDPLSRLDLTVRSFAACYRQIHSSRFCSDTAVSPRFGQARDSDANKRRLWISVRRSDA
jgi:hypothetical protein